ncbi:S8 family serine peptidase [Kitasatospora sp. NPDC004615]|uniref:S8 family serine peptidase n=1 Tax=Kitasatospora sp. NPDC004615 TaxID=3364017 RepID=UPI00367E70F3
MGAARIEADGSSTIEISAPFAVRRGPAVRRRVHDGPAPSPFAPGRPVDQLYSFDSAELIGAPERPSGSGHRELTAALDHAAAHDVLTVVAAGNQGRLGSSVLTRHHWTIPVVAYDTRNRPMDLSDLGSSIGTHGLGAPGRAVVHLNPGERPLALAGTSVAVPFVTGTLALLLSCFPRATPSEVRAAALHGVRRSVVPPLLNAWTAYERLRRAST